MGLKMTTPPPAEPVSLDELKAHLRVDTADEDDLIDAVNAAAREWVEEYTARQLVEAVYEWTLPRFPGQRWPAHVEHGETWHTPGFVTAGDAPLHLPRAPVRSIDDISYVDNDGQSQSFTAFQTDLSRVTTPPVVMPGAGETWPAVAPERLDGVTVTFTAGYEPGSGSPADYGANVPKRLRTAIKLLATHWYENRSAVMRDASPAEVPLTIVSLLSSLRMSYPA